MYRSKQNLMLLLVFSALTTESCSKSSIKPSIKTSINQTKNNSLPIGTKSTAEVEKVEDTISHPEVEEDDENIADSPEEKENNADIECDEAEDNSDDKRKDTNDHDSGIGSEEEDHCSDDEAKEECNSDQSSVKVDEETNNGADKPECDGGQEVVNTSEKKDSGPENGINSKLNSDNEKSSGIVSAKDNPSVQNSNTANTESLDGGTQGKKPSFLKQVSNGVKNGAQKFSNSVKNGVRKANPELLFQRHATA